MKKEILSMREIIYIMILFIFGSSVVIGVNKSVAQDTWIALLMAAVFMVPVILLYARIIKLFPGKDIYDILTELFGTFIGKIVITLITWYALHLAGLVLRDFSDFTEITALTETPSIAIMLAMLIVSTYLAASGIETMGKWTVLAFFVIITIIVFTIILALPVVDMKNFLPIMGHNFGEVASSSYEIVSYPFAETVIFLTLAGSLKQGDSPYKTFFYGILLAALVLLFIIFRNIAVLGSKMMEDSNFPSYSAVRLINITNVLERIGGLISSNFIFTGIVKIAVCMIAAARGFAKLFNIQEYRRILIPVSLFILAICSVSYNNTTELFVFLNVYKFYTIPFQFIIPIVVWIFAEIRMRKKAKAPQSA